MSDLTAVSLFDGIAGFPEALCRAGVQTVATVEIDQAAAGVAADHFPDAIPFDDVTKVKADDLRAAGFDPDRGILTGGWPCQDLSLAGRRLGLDGSRSGLFFEIVRLAADLRPRWLLLENVPGLLSAVCSCPGLGVCGTGCTDPHSVQGGACGPGRCMELHGGAMGAVLGALGDLGYGFAYRVLDAQHFGVPQRRRRVVIVGCLGDWAAPVAVLLEPEGGGGDFAPGRATGTRTTDGVDGVASTTGVDTITAPTPALESRRGYRVDAELAAGGGLVRHTTDQSDGTAGTAGSLLARSGKGPSSDLGDGQVVPYSFDQNMLGSPHDGQPIGPGIPVRTLRAHGHTHSVAYALRADPGGVGQGHNTNYVGFGETGGDVGAAIGQSPSIRTGSGGGATGVASTAAVRRLTPVECERLQGYPDRWTATSYGKPQSDSARYRQLGNSIAVPVFEWVARRIVKYDAETLDT